MSGGSNLVYQSVEECSTNNIRALENILFASSHRQ